MALKLVADNGQVVSHTESGERPINTYYYNSKHDHEASFAKRSRAKTLTGAVRAAVMRVLLGEYDKVQIYHDEGYFMASIVRSTNRYSKKQSIEIFGWFGSLE